jgi:hypothetical protein
MYGIMKAAPPLLPDIYGNFQMAPRPTAEPALARINPRRDPQDAVADIKNLCFLLVFGTGLKNRTKLR